MCLCDHKTTVYLICVFIFCGKTTPIVSHRELLSTGPSGVILSADDYFAHKDYYCYEPGLIGAAHEWNQNRGTIFLNVSPHQDFM